MAELVHLRLLLVHVTAAATDVITEVINPSAVSGYYGGTV